MFDDRPKAVNAKTCTQATGQGPTARKPGPEKSRAPKRPDVQIKRAYDEPSAGDGYRVLIDRIWPRGVAREQARLDEWARDLAPSAELRRWYGHDPDRFEEFRKRYRAELDQQDDALADLRRRARSQRVTIVFGARDAEHSNAAVLAELLGNG